MTYKEAINIIESYGDVAVDGDHLLVLSTGDWVAVNNETISYLKARGEDLNSSHVAKRVYKNALLIVESLEDPARIYPAGTVISRKNSIYPLG